MCVSKCSNFDRFYSILVKYILSIVETLNITSEMNLKCWLCFHGNKQSSNLKVQIFGNFALACENPIFRKKIFIERTNIYLY